MKAIYNGFVYKVVEKQDPFVILEGVGGYTFKAYMENVLFTDKPEEKLESERPAHDVLTPKEESSLPSIKKDKSLHIKEMPHVDTPDHTGFDFGFEKLDQLYPDENERRQAVIKMLSDILSGEKVTSIADGISIQLKTPEEIEEFKNELKSHPIFPFFSEKLFNMPVDELIDAAEKSLVIVEDEGGSWRLWTDEDENPLDIFSEENLKPVATDPDLVDAAKKVYSIFNNKDPRYKHRKPIYVGRFDVNRFIGMMKNAVKDLQRTRQPLTVPNFIHKLFEWFKQSHAKGKGHNVVGLDELEQELITNYSKREEPEPEPQKVEPEPTETPEDEEMQDIRDVIRRLADEGKINNNKVSTDDIVTVAPEADIEAVKQALESLGVEVEEQPADMTLEECGVTATAGAGVADGTVNQATDGVQGIAIRPEKLGASIRKRLEEEVGKIDIFKKMNETEVPLGNINPSKEPGQLKDKFELYKSIEKQKAKSDQPPTQIVQKENFMGDFGPREGLEGPFKMKNGKTYYYDPKEGKYYDPTKDMYVPNDDEELLQLTGLKEKFRDKNYTGLDDENPYNLTNDDAQERHKENQGRRKEVIEEMRTKIKKLFDNINKDDVYELSEESIDDVKSQLDEMIDNF